MCNIGAPHCPRSPHWHTMIPGLCPDLYFITKTRKNNLLNLLRKHPPQAIYKTRHGPSVFVFKIGNKYLV